MSETTATRSAAAERQRAHRDGLARRLDRLEAALESLPDRLAAILAEQEARQAEREHRRC